MLWVFSRCGKKSGRDLTDDTEATPAKPSRFGGRVNTLDVIVVCAFALCAFVYHMGNWHGLHPYPLYSADASNIAGFAAALDHPELFEGDEVLGDPSNFGWYLTFHVPLLRVLEDVTGDYGSAFISLLGLHVFLQALGFYLLGRVLYENRFWALLLAFVTLAPVWLVLGTFWGIWSAPLPRFSFQALLPFLLAATFLWRSRPERWPWIMAGAGALMYVHPVSAPSWAFALWAGLWALHPEEWSLGKRVSTMALLAAVFFAVSGPFVVTYFSSQLHGASNDVPYATVYPMLHWIYAKGFMDIPLAVREFIGLWTGAKAIFWVWAALGVGIVLWLRREDRRAVAVVGLWWGALTIVTILVPLTEQSIARAWERLPLEVDLVRGIRYFVPLMLLLCLWPLAEIDRRSGRARAGLGLRIGVCALGLALVVVWARLPQPYYARWQDPVRSAIDCWRGGQLTCPPGHGLYAADAIQAVERETPPGSRILPMVLGVQIRYMARRPVVYDEKDRGVLAYANHRKLLEWLAVRRRVEAILRTKGPDLQFYGLISLARELEAEYVLVKTEFAGGHSPVARDSYLGYPVVYENKRYVLLETRRLEVPPITSFPRPNAAASILVSRSEPGR